MPSSRTLSETFGTVDTLPPTTGSNSINPASSTNLAKVDQRVPTNVDGAPPKNTPLGLTESPLGYIRATIQAISNRARISLLAAGLMGLGSAVVLDFDSGQDQKEEVKVGFSSTGFHETTTDSGDQTDDTGPDDDLKMDIPPLDMGVITNLVTGNEGVENETQVSNEAMAELNALGELIKAIKTLTERNEDGVTELESLESQLTIENILNDPQESLNLVNNLLMALGGEHSKINSETSEKTISSFIKTIINDKIRIHSLSLDDPVKVLSQKIADVKRLRTRLNDVKKRTLHRMEETQKNSFVQLKDRMKDLENTLVTLQSLIRIYISDPELDQHSSDPIVSEQLTETPLGDFEDTCFSGEANGDVAFELIHDTLINLGYEPTGANVIRGRMTPRLKRYISRMQGSLGIYPITGEWDQKTMEAVEAICER